MSERRGHLVLKPGLIGDAGERNIVLNLFLNGAEGLVEKLSGRSIFEVQSLRRVAERGESTAQPAHVGSGNEPIAGQFPLKASGDGHFVGSLVIRIEVEESTLTEASVEEPGWEAGVIHVGGKRRPGGGAAARSRGQIAQGGETRVGGQISEILRDRIAEQKAGLIEFKSLTDEVDVVVDSEAGPQAGLAVAEQVAEETAGVGGRERDAQARFKIGVGRAVVARPVVGGAAKAIREERHRVRPGNSLSRINRPNAEDLLRGQVRNRLESVDLGKGIVELPAQSVGDGQP